MLTRSKIHSLGEVKTVLAFVSTAVRNGVDRGETESQLRVEVTKSVGVDWPAWAFSPGLKPDHGKMERFRGFENPLPRTEVRGWHGSNCSLLQIIVPTPPLTTVALKM